MSKTTEVIDVKTVRKRTLADGSMKITIHTRDRRKFVTFAHGCSEWGGPHEIVLVKGKIVSITSLNDN